MISGHCAPFPLRLVPFPINDDADILRWKSAVPAWFCLYETKTPALTEAGIKLTLLEFATFGFPTFPNTGWPLCWLVLLVATLL